MPTWKVLGVDADTGMESSLVVTASTESVARIMAERRGIIVAEVHDQSPRNVPGSIANLPTPPTANPGVAVRPGDIICPNPRCGYVGPPRRKARGSTLLLVLLLLLWILPGLLYLLFRSGYIYCCPRCGMEIRRDG